MTKTSLQTKHMPSSLFSSRAFKSTSASQKGFTLVEILIVIVIIGVLTAIGMGSFMSTQMKSRDGQRKSDLSNIARALEMYYNDKGRYPDAGTTTAGTILDIDWGSDSGLRDTDVTNGALYMAKMPQDPGEFNYYYVAEVNGTGYRLYAKLENEKDRSIVRDEDNAVVTYPGTLCTDALECNYGITSPNLSL